MLPQQFNKITTRGVRAMLLLRLETGSIAWVDQIAMRMTSDQASEDYTWLGTAPSVRKFIGGRQPAELRENGFLIANEDYESSVKFKSKDVRRDKANMIQRRINQLGDRVNDLPAKLLSTAILAGEASVCYDTKYFFDTTHVEDASGVQSNSIVYDISDNNTGGTPTVPTAETMARAILAAIQQMYGFKDDRGEPMNQGASRFLVMVPTTFLAAANEAVSSMLMGGGNTAVLKALANKFAIEVETNPRLTWTNKFAVFRTDDEAKPFIVQEENLAADGIVSLGEGTEYEQEHREHLYGVEWTGNVGYAYWQHAVLVTLQA